MMQYGVGTDIVEIKRFVAWQQYDHDCLRKIFTAEELAYAFSCPANIAQRLAVRFAAREAFFKAVHSLLPHVRIPLLTVMRNVSVTRQHNGAPALHINWNAFERYNVPTTITTSLSLSHTSDTALATVVIWFA